jgi:hypothetical protein
MRTEPGVVGADVDAVREVEWVGVPGVDDDLPFRWCGARLWWCYL